MTESERKKIADYLESGMTVGQIRQLMAMTSAEFTRAIAEMKRNGELPKRKLGKERIAEAMARGETNPYELAETYGYTQMKRQGDQSAITSTRPELSPFTRT